MSKFSLPFGIGGAVYEERKRQRITQRVLARKGGLSVPTVRQVECGGGRLSSLWSVFDALAVHLCGAGHDVQSISDHGGPAVD